MIRLLKRSIPPPCFSILVTVVNPESVCASDILHLSCCTHELLHHSFLTNSPS